MQKRVLILDDDRDFSRAVADRCENMELSVETVTNTTDATISLNMARPDIICVDVDPENNDSLTFCEYLAWNPESANIPIVVLTEPENIPAIQRCCALEARFISKNGDCWEKMQTAITDMLEIESLVTL